MQKYSFYHCILLLPLLEYVISIENAYNWGVYKTYFHSLKLCEGHKRTNITLTSFKIHYDPVNDTTYFNGNTTTKKDGGLLMGRVRLWKWSEKSGRYEILVTFNAPNLCDFPAVKKHVLDKGYLTDDKCNVKKGKRLVQQLDLDVVGHYYMGERFFHGKFKILMDFYTSKENVVCFKVILELMDIEGKKEYRKKISEEAEGVTKVPA